MAYTKEEIISELQRWDKIYSNSPRKIDWDNDNSFPTSKTVLSKFCSWNNGLLTANLSINTPKGKVIHSDKALLDSIKSLADKLNKNPTYEDYSSYGKFGTRTLEYRFGSWKNAKELVGLIKIRRLRSPKKRRWLILKRDNFTCQYCGRKAPEVVLQVDHKDSRKNGGGNEASNLITSCRDCNIGKNSDSFFL